VRSGCLRLRSWAVLAACAIALSPAGAAAQSGDAILFRDLILQRRQAYGRGDTAAYARLVADSLVHIDDRGMRRDRAAVMRFVKENAGGRARYVIGDLHVRRTGSIAVVDCDVTEFIPFGPREQRIAAHELNVFEMHGARWLLVQHAETPLLGQPDSVAMDSLTLDQYVGRYEWYPGFVDTITRRGNQLFILSTGESEPAPLSAAGNGAVVIEGDPSVGFFTRDASGKVDAELVHFLDGRLVRARRVP
jgi:SnoaL-like domain